MDIATLIQNAADGDNVGASTIFDELMKNKVNDALEAEKVKMADVVFNGATDEDPEIEDEDLEEDEDVSDEDDDEEEDEDEEDDDESEEDES